MWLKRSGSKNRKNWWFAAGVIVAIVMLGLGVTMIAAGTEKRK